MTHDSTSEAQCGLLSADAWTSPAAASNPALPSRMEGLKELALLVEMMNRREISVEVRSGMENEAEWYEARRLLVIAVDITPYRLRNLRRQVAGRLLSGRW